jgi:hypothetical protein
MKKAGYITIIIVIILIIIACIVLGIVLASNNSSTNDSTTTYTISCLDGPSIRSIQFSGPFYINTVGNGAGQYTLSFYNPLNVLILTQVYVSGIKRYIIPPPGSTYFEYTFLCS